MSAREIRGRVVEGSGIVVRRTLGLVGVLCRARMVLDAGCGPHGCTLRAGHSGRHECDCGLEWEAR